MHNDRINQHSEVKMKTNKIEIGDKITFRAATRWNCGKVTRVVNGFYDSKNKIPTVRYGGWSDFVVKPNEIKKNNDRINQHSEVKMTTFINKKHNPDDAMDCMHIIACEADKAPNKNWIKCESKILEGLIHLYNENNVKYYGKL